MIGTMVIWTEEAVIRNGQHSCAILISDNYGLQFYSKERIGTFPARSFRGNDPHSKSWVLV